MNHEAKWAFKSDLKALLAYINKNKVKRINLLMQSFMMTIMHGRTSFYR